jgi:hypothetical protein
MTSFAIDCPVDPANDSHAATNSRTPVVPPDQLNI